jgi:hypothetical protein
MVLSLDAQQPSKKRFRGALIAVLLNQDVDHVAVLIHSTPEILLLPVDSNGTKTAKILALLRRPNGATLKELCKASGWQAHSVRGFLSGTLKKKMGVRVDSEPRDNGQRAYRLVSK